MKGAVVVDKAVVNQTAVHFAEGGMSSDEWVSEERDT